MMGIVLANTAAVKQLGKLRGFGAISLTVTGSRFSSWRWWRIVFGINPRSSLEMEEFYVSFAICPAFDLVRFRTSHLLIVAPAEVTSPDPAEVTQPAVVSPVIPTSSWQGCDATIRFARAIMFKCLDKTVMLPVHQKVCDDAVCSEGVTLPFLSR